MTASGTAYDRLTEDSADLTSSDVAYEGKITSAAIPLYSVTIDAVPEDLHDWLRAEARRLRPSALRRERREPEMANDGRLLCPLRNWYAGEAALDCRVAASGLVTALESRPGLAVCATRVSLLYYETGDFLGLHRDHPSCALTLLLWLDGRAGALSLHPELAGASEEALARGGPHPRGGVYVDLQDGPLLLQGGIVPHHRPPHPHAAELAVASVCFTTDAVPAGQPLPRPG